MNTVKKSIKHTLHGFTLVESLVAVSILVIVVVGPMTIAMRGLQTALFANEQTAAVYLAQEAIESIEKLRDENALSVYHDTGETQTWNWYDDSGSNNPIHYCKSGNGTGKCDLDVLDVDGDYRHCTGGSLCQLNFDENGNDGYFYKYDNSYPLSPFTRQIHIDEPSQGIVEVTVTVTWDTPIFSSGSSTVELRAWYYDHYDRYE